MSVTRFIIKGSFFGSLVLFAFLCSCENKNANKVEIVEFLTVVDDLGRIVKVKKNANRFLPLAPSVTEMLYLVCDAKKIVGRTPNCNFPSALLAKPIVNNYPPDLERILFLHPDLVITKDGMLSLSQAEAIEKMGVPVYFQKYNSVEDIFVGITKLGELTGNKEIGKIKADSLRLIISKNIKLVGEGKKKKVLLLISKERYFSFGKNSYASDILAISGAVNAVDSIYDSSYPVLSSEYILKINPDIIIGGEQVGLENDFFEWHKELKRTNAYKNGQCFTINDDYLSRPGPRVVEAINIVRSIVNGSYLKP